MEIKMLLINHLKKTIVLLAVLLLLAVISVHQSSATVESETTNFSSPTQLWSGYYNPTEFINFRAQCIQQHPGYDSMFVTIVNNNMLRCRGVNYITTSTTVTTSVGILETRPWNGSYDNAVFTAFQQQCEANNPDVDQVWITHNGKNRMYCYGENYDTVTAVSLLNEGASSTNTAQLLVYTLLFLGGLTVLSRRRHKSVQ